MGNQSLGYKGKVLRALKEAKAEIGDIIRIKNNKRIHEGILIPRSQYGNEKYIVIKLKNGYNIGVRVTPVTSIEKVKVGVKPTFLPSPLPKQSKKLPKVAIISTGGTIASRVDYRTGGVRPALSATDLYGVVPELSKIALIETEILYSLLSENIKANHWSKLAKEVEKKIKKGSTGIVIAHGTDTMGYTSAALSFALQGLPVPVIIVGSQRSADRPSSDAASNLIGAVVAASKAPFAEVAIAMHTSVSDKSVTLHRGTKARKCHTSRRDAFKSINSCPLAKMENGQIEMLTNNYLKRNPIRKLILKSNFDERVALVKFYPSLSPNLFEWYIDNSYKGIVLEGTGLGHVGNYCLPAIKKAIDSGLLICMTPQCIWGRINMNVYNQGRDLLAMGVIPLEDMLPETALVKLMWAFGQTKDIDEVKKTMLTNISYEISKRTTYEVKKKGEEKH